MLKFHELMNTEDVSLLTKVAFFFKTIVMCFDMTKKSTDCNVHDPVGCQKQIKRTDGLTQ